MTDQTPCKTPVEIFALIVMPMQMSPSAMTTLLWEPCKNLSLENYVHASEIFSMDHHCCTTTAVWFLWSWWKQSLDRHSFLWLSQAILFCTGEKEKAHTSGYSLHPPFIFDLQALTYLYIWPARSELSWHLTFQFWPTFILDLQAEVCTAPRVGHRDPIKPHCSLCADVGHDDKARGPEHYGLVRPTDTVQSDAVWLRLGAASAVCWRPQEGEGHFRWRWERCDVKADRHWVNVESHLTDIFISSRGACVADMYNEICSSKQVKKGRVHKIHTAAG